MINWQSVPALRAALAFALGITLSAYLPVTTYLKYTFFGLILSIGLIPFLIRLSLTKQRKFRNVGLLIILIASGSLLSSSAKTIGSTPHSLAGISSFLVQLDGKPTLGKTWLKVKGTVRKSYEDGKSIAQNTPIQLFLASSYRRDSLSEGDLLLVNQSIRKPTYHNNPNAFEYAALLRSQGIEHLCFIQDQRAKVLKSTNSGVFSRIRTWISRRLAKAITTPNELAVAQALVLGDKQLLNKDLKEVYTNTGAVHVLAVSGLHTGIIAALLMWLLGFAPKHKHIKLLKLILFWLGLWGYAALTGYSPSVMRSALMFGLLFTAKILHLEGQSLNSLGLSALLLLIFDPQLLFDVGFQLSYSAVAGILAFQPTFRTWFRSEISWVNFLGELNALSLAATLGTLPITIYHFHQFPIYFLLSSLCAVPIVSLALPALLGALNLDAICALFGVEALWSYVFSYILVWLNNSTLFAIGELPQGVLTNLYPSTLSTLLLYCFIVLAGCFFLVNKKRVLRYALIAGMCWGLSCFGESLSDYTRDETIVYNLKDGIQVDHFQAGKVRTLVNDTLLSDRDLATVTANRSALNASLSGQFPVRCQSFLSAEVCITNVNQLQVVVVENGRLSGSPAGLNPDLVVLKTYTKGAIKSTARVFPEAQIVLAYTPPPWEKAGQDYPSSGVHNLKLEGPFIF